MKLYFTLLFLLFYCNELFSQTSSIKVNFRPEFGNELIVPNTQFSLNNDSDLISFQTVKFFISEIILLKNNTIIYQEPNSFHLIDISDTNSFLFPLNLSSNIVYDKIQFNLGIDSIINVSGVYGGPLDPTKGMYWTWQSGYINVKLEGITTKRNYQNNEFEFHLGGYQAPFNSLQKVSLSVMQNSSIFIAVNLNKYFNSINLINQHHVMSPSKFAVDLSELFKSCFYIKNDE